MAFNIQSGQNYIYKLLGSELSLFTGKARAYLKWKGIQFEEVIASDIVYQTMIHPWAHVSFIPVLLVYHATGTVSKEDTSPPKPFLVIQDTKAIMDHFENKRLPPVPTSDSTMRHPVVPESLQLGFASMVMELLADEWLLLQAMYWRWGKGNFEKQDRFLAFEFGRSATAGVSSLDETLAVAAKRMPRFAGFLPNLGISASTSSSIRAQFHTLLQLMSAHLSFYPFLLGFHISLADFAFYGSFYAHLGRDPVPSFIIKTEAPLVWEWIERVGGLARWASRDLVRWDAGERKWKATYGETKEGNAAPLLDNVPESAGRLVELLLKDYILILKDTLVQTLGYISNIENESPKGGKSREGISLPRTLGRHDFKIRSVAGDGIGERAIYTHAVWIFDRLVHRTYSTPEQVAASDDWLATLDDKKELLRLWKECVTLWRAGGWIVQRKDNKLVVTRRDREAVQGNL